MDQRVGMQSTPNETQKGTHDMAYRLFDSEADLENGWGVAFVRKPWFDTTWATCLVMCLWRMHEVDWPLLLATSPWLQCMHCPQRNTQKTLTWCQSADTRHVINTYCINYWRSTWVKSESQNMPEYTGSGALTKIMGVLQGFNDKVCHQVQNTSIFQDMTAGSVTQKLLQRPRALERIRSIIDQDKAAMTCFNSTATCQKLGEGKNHCGQSGSICQWCSFVAPLPPCLQNSSPLVEDWRCTVDSSGMSQYVSLKWYVFSTRKIVVRLQASTRWEVPFLAVLIFMLVMLNVEFRLLVGKRPTQAWAYSKIPRKRGYGGWAGGLEAEGTWYKRQARGFAQTVKVNQTRPHYARVAVQQSCPISKSLIIGGTLGLQHDSSIKLWFVVVVNTFAVCLGKSAWHPSLRHRHARSLLGNQDGQPTGLPRPLVIRVCRGNAQNSPRSTRWLLIWFQHPTFEVSLDDEIQIALVWDVWTYFNGPSCRMQLWSDPSFQGWSKNSAEMGSRFQG